MDDDTFWNHIDTLNGHIDEDSAARLSEDLASSGAASITGFADRLAEALFALDTAQGAACAVVDPSVGDEPFSMSDDLFLYARCAVVASGRQEWERVRADPAAMAGRWAVFDGEWLLTAASQAYEEATGEDWTHEAPVSYETGSNEDGWSDEPGPHDGPASDGVPDGQDALPRWTVAGPWPEPPAHRPWLEAYSRVEKSLPSSSVHGRVEGAYANAINFEPAWVRWWQASGLRDLRLTIWLGPAGERDLEIQRGKKNPDRRHPHGRPLPLLSPPAGPGGPRP